METIAASNKVGYPAQFFLDHHPRLFPELAKRNDQEVIPLFEVPLSVETAGGERIFHVRFSDGYEANVYESELLCLHDKEDNASDCLLLGDIHELF